MSQPAYQRVAQAIRDSLGEPGSEVPSEAALIAEHGVSRNTVRRALSDLEAEGLITSGQGSRRQVREIQRWCWPMHQWEAPEHHTNEGDAWATSIRNQGGKPHTTVAVSVVEASQDVADALDVPKGSPVVMRSRVRSVDEMPHQLQESTFPTWLTQMHPEFMTPGDVAAPGGLLAAAGLRQQRMHDTITARMPSAEEAATLHMGPGTPLLVHCRTGYDQDGRPVRYMVTKTAADRTQMSYDLEA